MFVNTLDFGKVQLVKETSITIFDNFIAEIEGSEIDQYFRIYQLADGHGSIVAVEVRDF